MRSQCVGGFRIYVGTVSGVLSLAATVGAGAESYSLNGLNAATQYFVQVRAYNSGGNSTPSNEVSATTAGGGEVIPTLRSARAPRYAIPRT